MHSMEISRSLAEIEHRVNGISESLSSITLQLEKLIKDFNKLNSLIIESTQTPTLCEINEYISGAAYPEI